MVRPFQAWLLGLVCSAGTCVVAASAPVAAASLPEGLPREPSGLITLGRLLLTLLGLVLLLGGSRWPIATATLMFLVPSLAIGLMTLATTSYLLALAGALAVAAVGLALLLRFPRIGWGLASSWPLAAAYQAHLLLSGSLERHHLTLLVLMLLGAGLGAAWPGRAPALVATALGTVALAAAWPGAGHTLALLGVAAVGLAWQWLGLARLGQPLDQPPRPWRDRASEAGRVLLRHVGWAGTGVLLLLLVTSLTAPAPGPLTPRASQRLERLQNLHPPSRPGLVLSRADSFYVLGAALPVAFLGHDTLWQRLTMPVRGRSPSLAIHELRGVKTTDEIATMRRAAAITAGAFVAVTPRVRAGTTEAELEEVVLKAFRAGGATGIAFRPIIASGANAVLPHYDANRATLAEGLVVIDIGCMVDGYSSDMTRTFPVLAAPTLAQRRLLTVVQAAKRTAEEVCRAGVAYQDLHQAAKAVITRAGFGAYFTHFVGHHVGIQTHDTGPRRLEEGCVITIEPGIYVPRQAHVDKAYWDLGVRLEDTYVVRATSCEPLASYPDLPWPTAAETTAARQPRE